MYTIGLFFLALVLINVYLFRSDAKRLEEELREFREREAKDKQESRQFDGQVWQRWRS